VFSFYFNIALIYIILGFVTAVFFFFVLKRDIFGRFWGALIVALIGSFAGGVFGYLFDDVIERLTHLNGTVNIFPPLITAFICIWVFSSLSEKQKKDD
jgi:membrane protein YqaA with SNARE-associated domain